MSNCKITTYSSLQALPLIFSAITLNWSEHSLLRRSSVLSQLSLIDITISITTHFAHGWRIVFIQIFSVAFNCNLSLYLFYLNGRQLSTCFYCASLKQLKQFFSRVIIYLSCHNNNSADTGLCEYLKGVENFGLSSRVHSDQGA